MRHTPPVRLSVLTVLCAAAAATAAAQPPATAPPLPTPPPPTPPAAAEPKWPSKVGEKSLGECLDLLKDSPDGQVRELAVKALPLFGPSARKVAIKPLIAAVRDRDPGVRINALIALGAVGADDDKEAREIGEALSLAITNAGPGSTTRLYAVRSLGNYGPPAAARGLPAASSVLDDPSWETRHSAANTIAALGRSPDPAKTGPDAKAMKTLADRLSKEDSAAVRLELVQSLIVLGPPKVVPNAPPAEYARQVKPYLDAVMARAKVEKDKSVQVWLLVLAMLYDGTQFNDENVRKLAAHINGTDVPARVAALRALGLIGEKAKGVVGEMTSALNHEDPAVVAEALSALAAMKQHATAALPAIEALKGRLKDVKDDDPKSDLKRVAEWAANTIQNKPAAAPPAPKK